MATTIVITCPDCKKQLKGPAELAGKKVRCKSCGHIFTVKAGADTPAPAPAGKKAAPAQKDGKGAPRSAAKANAEPRPATEEDDKRPYGFRDVVLTPRCPHCAAEFEDEEQVICLNCGYNKDSRQRMATVKTVETTTLEYMIWLMPGIICAILAFALLGVIGLLWYLHYKYGTGDDWKWYGHFALSVWGSVISAGIAWVAGKFAFRRLVLNPHPPEKIKR